MHTSSRLIDTGWSLKEASQEGRPAYSVLPSMPAQVPGHVHLDLMRAGVIADPFERMNERGVEWIDETGWVYETTFHVDAILPGRTYLVFDGVDTVAGISLNGETIAHFDNMFVPHEVDVTSTLKQGENTLRVEFSSAAAVGRKRLAEWEAEGNPTTRLGTDCWGARSFVRKAQYMYGWDWGPVLRSCGLWRGVRLVNIPVARITSWRYDVTFMEGDSKALVGIDATIERFVDAPLELFVSVCDVTAWGEPLDVDLPSPVSVIVPGSTKAGSHTVRATIEVSDPKRWWPNGTENAMDRAPHLYGIDLNLDSGAQEVDGVSGQIGLRTVELIREPDPDGKGEGFKFRINGVDLFAKGANWIPADSFPSRLPNEAACALDPYDQDSRVERLICLARDAGMNMLRIWGGGLYESEHFYELCDEQGIMVWQDFPYGCAYYPDTGVYADAAQEEAVAAVRRLRVHPSLVLWCGNNENQQMHWDQWCKPAPERLLGEHLYDEILPQVVAQEDPSTPYWPGSPSGVGDPGSCDYGDRHNWDVWHGRGDWKYYTQDRSRFCSEFGFASSCGLRAWDKTLAPQDRSPYSPVVRWHDKTRKGYDVYLDMVRLHYPEPLSIEDLVYFTQINQAEALTYGVEHYRRNKGRCWGTLFWQINDCWPVQSWAVIDSTIEPKAAYFAAKSFYAPVLLSHVVNGNKVDIHLVNDLLEPIKGKLSVVAETFDGKRIVDVECDVNAAANSACCVASYDMASIAGREHEAFVYVHFDGDHSPSADNYLFFAEPKDWRRPNPELKIDITLDDGVFEVAITAVKFAPYVWLRLSDDENLFQAGLDDGDNFFHVRAGTTHVVRLCAREGLSTVDELRSRMVVRSF